MSVEDEKKKPRKSPAKKAASAASTEGTVEKKAAKAASPKTSTTKKKTATKPVNGKPLASAASPASTQPIGAAATQLKPHVVTHAQVAERAYHYFLARGQQHGFHEQDWFRAQQDLSSEG